MADELKCEAPGCDGKMLLVKKTKTQAILECDKCATTDFAFGDRLQSYRIEMIQEILRDMTDEERTAAFSAIRAHWCQSCGKDDSTSLMGCRCDDDS